MTDEKEYECEDCKKRVRVNADEDEPECCGKPMTRLSLEACTSAGPEHARPMEPEETCDDSRGG